MKKVLFILIACALFLGWVANASVFTQEPMYKEIEVQYNDTLWDIAAREVNQTTDIRKYIYDIKQLNHMNHSDTLVPGQTLKMPILPK